MVRRIKDDLIDTWVFEMEVGNSDLRYILILPVCFLKVKPKVNKKKSGGTRPGFITYLLSDRYPIQKLEIPNLKFEIPNYAKKRWVNTQLPPILIWSYVRLKF